MLVQILRLAVDIEEPGDDLTLRGVTRQETHGAERVVRVVLTDDGARPAEESRLVAVDPVASGETISMDVYRAARIVREHGGVLSAASVTGGGIRLTLELPAV